jgi:hypothetical protein
MDAQLAELTDLLAEARLDDDTAEVFRLLAEIDKLLDQRPDVRRSANGLA